MVIYCITNRRTGQRYVGRTVRPAQRRWDDHLSACYTKLLRSELYDDMRELGREQFEWTILEHVDTYDALTEREIAWIEILGTMQPDGYNRVRGGASNLGWKPTAETRSRMSAWQRGRKLSQETRAKVSASLIGNTRNLGRNRDTSWNRGIKATPEHRRRLSVAARGKPWSDQERKGHTGLKRTTESNALIAQRKRDWWASLSPEQKTLHVEKIRRGHMKENS